MLLPEQDDYSSAMSGPNIDEDLERVTESLSLDESARMKDRGLKSNQQLQSRKDQPQLSRSSEYSYTKRSSHASRNKSRSNSDSTLRLTEVGLSGNSLKPQGPEDLKYVTPEMWSRMVERIYNLNNKQSEPRFVIAAREYVAEDSNSLSLRHGDRVELLGEHEGGWSDGILNGRRGWFPSTYCVSPEEFSQGLGPPSSRAITQDWSLGQDLKGSGLAESSMSAMFAVIGASQMKHPAQSDSAAPRGMMHRAHKLSRVGVFSPKISRTDHDHSSDSELSFIYSSNMTGSLVSLHDLAPSSWCFAVDLSARLLDAYAAVLQRSRTRIATRPTRDESEQSSSASSPMSSARSKDTEMSMASMGKRKLSKINEQKNNSDDDEEEGAVPPKKRSNASDAAVRLFACPFAKYDPERYSERNLREREYRSCSSCLLRDIARLKQHLYRVHRRPDYYCPSCFEAFKSQGILDDHVRQRSCQLSQPLYAEKMTKDQMNQIKRRNRGESALQNWFSIYQLLFPGAPLPVSPYAGEGKGDQVALQHFVHFFRTFGPEQFFNLMRDRQGAAQQMEASTQAIVDEAFEITAPELLRQWRSQSVLLDPRGTHPVQTRYESAILAARTVSDMMYNESSHMSMPMTQGFAQLQPTPDPWLQPWSSPNMPPINMLPEDFDIDTNFDPLTIEDSFEAYGGWYV